MTLDSRRRSKVTGAILVYVILLLSLQVFLLIVAVEGLLDGDAGLAWSATGISIALFLSASFFYRYLRHE
jgi:Na+/melibiose symporter-like transporter